MRLLPRSTCSLLFIYSRFTSQLQGQPVPPFCKSIMFHTSQKKRKKNPTLNLQRIAEEEMLGTLKHIKNVPCLEPYKQGRKYVIPISSMATLRSEMNALEVIDPPLYTQNYPVLHTVDALDLDPRLFAFQRADIRKAIQWGRALLGHSMGCGKSAIAIALAKYYNGRTVVISPAYLTLNWVREAAKWGLELLRVTGKDPIPSGSFVISYDIAAKRVAELGSCVCIVLDESQYVKSHKTKRTKNLRGLVLRTPHAFLLSGTPCPNRPVELYSQLAMLQPRCFGTYTNFAQRYCGAKRSPLGFVDVSGATNKEELAYRLQATCVIRRLKRDVLTDLPLKTRTRVDLVVTKSRDIERHKRRWQELNRAEQTGELSHAEVLERQRIVSELFRCTCLAKSNAVRKYCTDLPDNIIVFCYHQQMMDAVCEVLPNHIRIDGKTPMEARQQRIDSFQAGEFTHAVLSIGACSTGLTITACSTIVFAEMYFVPGILLQAEDRCHRIGQTNPVDIRYLVASNTLDEHVYKMVQNKLKTIDQCLDGRKDRKW